LRLIRRNERAERSEEEAKEIALALFEKRCSPLAYYK